jgi:hypothetical protein
MTSYLKMTTVQEKAMCVFWFCEAKSVIKMQRRYRTQSGEDSPSYNATGCWLRRFQEIGNVVSAIEQLHRKCWRTLGWKLNTPWTSYMQ